MNISVGLNDIQNISNLANYEDYENLAKNEKNILSKFPDCTILSTTVIITFVADYFITNVSEFKDFKNNSETRYAISCISLSTNIVSDDGNEYLKHANILLYDRLENRVERFEPNGLNVSFYNNQLVDDTLFQKFKDIDIQYTQTNYFLPKTGPQIYDHKLNLKNGVCTVWCILYIFLRIAYPDISLNDLIIQMNRWNKKTENNICKIIDFFNRMI